MKAYGHSRRDKLECIYGCCTQKSGAKKNCREVVDRANRKTARQEEQRGLSREQRLAFQADTEDFDYPSPLQF